MMISNIRACNLDDLANVINRVNETKGWNEEKSESDWAMLAVSEIAEAFEEYRNDKPLIYPGENGKPEGLAIEYADTLIRVLHWFARHNLSPTEAVRIKMEYNLTRPYRHGGKKV